MAEMTPYAQDIRALFKTGLDLGRLKGTKILITGATGLIGSCLVDMFMAWPNQDYEVYALGRNIQRARLRFAQYWDAPAFHFIQHDVCQQLQTEIVFDYIIHAASNASPNFFKTHPVEVMKANLDGVSNLLSYGLAHDMKRLLYISSGEIYGEGDGRTFEEHDSGYVDCATPRACYPSSKRAAETLCVSYGAEYGADVVIARLCHTYGPYFTESDNRVYAQFIRNVMDGSDIVLKSPGSQFRSWLYVVDAVSALLTILLKGENGEAYNVADERSNVTIRHLAELVAQLGSKKVVFDFDPQTADHTPITKATFSTEKLSRLGWSPRTSLEEGLAHTIATAEVQG